jgi:hypothetical protein
MPLARDLLVGDDNDVGAHRLHLAVHVVDFSATNDLSARRSELEDVHGVSIVMSGANMEFHSPATSSSACRR